MRRVLVVLAFLFVVPAAHADAPAGFREATSLEPAASFAAGKAVAVYCAHDASTFGAAASAAGVATGESTTGFATVGGGAAYLSATVCAPLTARLAHRHVDDYDLAFALLVLTHEATHLRGVADECATELAALRSLTGIASRYFAFATWRSRHDLAALAWNSHYSKPAAYWDCGPAAR